MVDRPRANLGFDDPLASFDPGDFAPDPATVVRQRPEAALSRAVAEHTGFHSREAGQGAQMAISDLQPAAPVTAAEPVAATQPVRRRRTGRNAQFNLKAKPETIAAFCAVADENGWGLGETLEYAVALLERDYRR